MRFPKTTALGAAYYDFSGHIIRGYLNQRVFGTWHAAHLCTTCFEPVNFERFVGRQCWCYVLAAFACGDMLVGHVIRATIQNNTTDRMTALVTSLPSRAGCLVAMQ